MAARTHQRKLVAGRAVTSDRVARLYRLLALLAQNPVARPALLRRLGMTQRSFYRDIELLRSIGIPVTTENSHYGLEIELGQALERLPFPDPLLTLGEAIRLAKGRTAAHKTLQQRVDAIIKPPKRANRRRKR
jgi:predicted DNA-binding transcriptional regulator YafY